MIEIENLRFAWPRAESDCLAIDRLSIAAGSTLFLYGPSGSGKSTLLGLLAGVLVARQGRVGVLDTDWSSLSGARRDALRADHVGYIFQQFNLLPYLNVIDNVLLPCRFSRLRHERAVRRSGSVQADAGALLAHVGLAAKLWRRKAAELSVGQQQRVAVARALANRPRVILADEPTASIDTAHQDQVIELLKNTCAEQDVALLIVTHSPAVAARFPRRLQLEDFNRAAVHHG